MTNDTAATPQDVETFRVGNFVEFPNYSFLEITGIDNSTGNRTYSVSLNGQERTGIPDGMMTVITLEERHLYALGFTRDQHNIYNLADINLIRPMYPDGENFANPGWRIYRPGAQIFRQAGQQEAEFVEQNTASVSTVSKLQNYLADQGRQFDFTPLRQFQSMAKR